MATIEKSVEIEVPVRTAYNQWTQFEEFPRFMEGVKRVRQLDDTHLEWVAAVGGVDKTWEAEITEQIPDKRIAWRSRYGAKNAGVVTFHRIHEHRTRVMLQLDYEPEGITETAADMLGLLARRIEGDLGRFKEFIEARGRETGAWRGRVETPEEGGGVRRPGGDEWKRAS